MKFERDCDCKERCGLHGAARRLRHDNWSIGDDEGGEDGDGARARGRDGGARVQAVAIGYDCAATDSTVRLGVGGLGAIGAIIQNMFDLKKEIESYEKADIFCLLARMLHRTQKLNQHFVILSGNKKTVVCVFHMKKTSFFQGRFLSQL